MNTKRYALALILALAYAGFANASQAFTCEGVPGEIFQVTRAPGVLEKCSEPKLGSSADGAYGCADALDSEANRIVYELNNHEAKWTVDEEHAADQEISSLIDFADDMRTCGAAIALKPVTPEVIKTIQQTEALMKAQGIWKGN